MKKRRYTAEFKKEAARMLIFEGVGALELRHHVFEYIEVFYNRIRKHASLGYKNPVQIEVIFYPNGGKEPSMAA